MQQESSQQVIENKDGDTTRSDISKEILASTDVGQVKKPFTNFDSQIAFDSVNDRNIGLFQDQVSDGDKNQTKGSLVIFDKDGIQINAVDLSRLVDNANENVLRVDASEQDQKQKSKYEFKFSDNLSILRFVKGNKCKGLDISSSGFTLKLSKSQSKKANEEELIWTNMAFTSGIHFWEFIAPISCNNIQMGVYNPVTKETVMTSFKTSTMRTITVCLDFNEDQLKFWLNDRRSSNKTLKLPSVDGNCGPWIPCVKISQERNKIILNPFAREPSDFHEKDFDKKFHLKKYLMPHLYNMICVMKLPKVENIQDELKNFPKMIKVQRLEISESYITQDSISSEYENKRFCFIRFNHHDFMADFIQKNTQYAIYQQGQLAQWFLDKTIVEQNENLQAPFKIISELIQIPVDNLTNTLTSINQAFQIVQNQVNGNDLVKSEEQSKENYNLKLGQQQFTDKLIVAQNDKVFKAISRNQSTLDFDIEDAVTIQPPKSLNSNVLVKLTLQSLQLVLSCLNWSSILRDNNEQVNSIFRQFFNSLGQSIKFSKDQCSFKAPLNITKFFLDISIQYMRSQLDRVKRQYQNYQTIIPAKSLVNRSKPEIPLDIIKEQPFYRDHNLSVDELYSILHILYDLQEQVWAQTRMPTCRGEVKQLLTSISRPFSALNRLGSFVAWGLNEVEAVKLAESGFIYKENQTLNQFENQLIELQDLSEKHLFDIEALEQFYSNGNRLLNASITENIPLSKSLNYLPATEISSGSIIDIIPAVNNDFTLIGDSSGRISICSSQLGMTLLKSISMSLLDFSQKSKINQMVQQKVQERESIIMDYQKQNNKRLIPLSVLKNYKIPPKEQQKTLQAQKIKNSKESKMKYKKDIPSQSNSKKGKQTQKAKSVTTNTESVTASTTQNKSVKTAGAIVVPDIQTMTNDSFKQSEIIGYFFLSKPKFENAFDPLVIGCVIYSPTDKKYIIRVRTLYMCLQYLHSFILLDPISGLLTNKLNGKLIVGENQLKQAYDDILNCSEIIYDLYPFFMKNQVLKRDYVRKDSKFSIFNEVVQDQIEIENCSKIIDFTKCSYSIVQSKKGEYDSQIFSLHFLIENQSSQTQLVQYHIETSCYETLYNGSATLKKGKELDLDPGYQRIFQVDQNLVMVQQSSFKIIDQKDFAPVYEENFKQEIKDFALISIINKTEFVNQFNASNIKRFNQIAAVPKQRWSMAIQNQANKAIDYYDIDKEFMNKTDKQPLMKQQTEKLEEVDLKSADPQDILQIGNLLESKQLGTIARINKNCILSSSGLDLTNNLRINHSWQIINSKAPEYEFELLLNNKEAESSQNSNHLKEVEMELSFKKKSSKSLELTVKKETQLEIQQPKYDENSISRMPLVVEQFTGAQLNDLLQTSYLTNPDPFVFSSNYPQPEFIFRHLNNHSFTPTQFVIRSKENREWNGVPIGQGLIFVSDNLEDLLNTKQFSRFQQRQYDEWKAERLKTVGQLPLLSNEPVAFFDMDDKTEVIVNVNISGPFKFIKMIPTAFREYPINFTCKNFNSNQAEIQFFGVNGLDLGHQSCQNANTSVQKIVDQIDLNQLQLSIDSQLIEKNLGLISKLQQVKIQQIRGPRPDQSMKSLLSVKDLKIQNVIYVSNHVLAITEEHSDSANHLIFKIKNLQSEDWELSGVKLSVKSYTDQSSQFKSESLQASKAKLRHYLLDVTLFDKLLKKIIDLAQSKDISDYSVKEASLKCILNFLKNNKNDRNFDMFQREFVRITDIKSLLNDDFIDASIEYQNFSLEYLSFLNLLKNEKQFINEFLKQQLKKLFEKSRPIQKIEGLLQLLLYLDSSTKQQIQLELTDLLFNRISNEELPKLQTAEYITLRSKLNINQFPFDNKVGLKSLQKERQLAINDATASSLDFKFDLVKYNTLYQYKIELNNTTKVSKIILHFEADPKSLYKVNIKIIVPDSSGKEIVHYEKLYDESYYQQLCEKAQKQEIINYFHQKPFANHSSNEDVDHNSLALNQLHLNLTNIETKFIKLQIEFMDTNRTVHKTCPITQAYIRPQIFGIKADTQSAQLLNEEQKSTYQRFIVTNKELTVLLGNNQHQDLTYFYYLTPDQSLSVQHKACSVIVKNKQSDKQRSDFFENQEQEIESVNLSQEQVQNQVAEIRQEIKSMLQDHSKNRQSKNQVKSKASQLWREYKNYLVDSDDISLRYLLHLSELLAQQVVIATQINPQLLANYDHKTVYIQLFKRFFLFDQKHLYPHMQKLLDVLFSKIQNSSRFICDLFNDFLLKSDSNINQKNAIDFIRQQKNVDYDELIENFAQNMNLSTDRQEITQNDILQIFKSLGNEISLRQPNSYSIQSIMAFVSIFDQLDKDSSLKKITKVDLLLQILVSMINNCSQFKDLDLNKSTVTLQYILQVVTEILHSINLKQSNIYQNSQLEILTFMLQSILRKDDNLKVTFKEFFQILTTHDVDGTILKSLKLLLEWYIDNSNMEKVTDYYEDFGESKQTVFYKHLTKIFKYYMNIKQTNKLEINIDDEKLVQDITSKLLKILVECQNLPNYEDNYLHVWSQIFYQALKSNQNSTIIQQISSQFFGLSELSQEILYPKLHSISEKYLKIQPSSNPEGILKVLEVFLMNGFANPQNIKISYCFCDGLLNIIQSSQKDKSSATQIQCKFTNPQIQDLLKVFIQFLCYYASLSVFTGAAGACYETVMKLDLAISMSNILINALNSDNQVAFDEYIKSCNTEFPNQIDQLLQWQFINYSKNKSKNSPAGQRIFTLSQNIETLISKVSLSEAAVSLCLPILMNSVLQTDFKLRQLILDDKINNERAIFVQKNVNILFLTYFKEWINSDLLAKKFLTEFNGFDFLLDRLFSKQGSNDGDQEQILSESLDQDEVIIDEVEDNNEDDEEGLLFEQIVGKLKLKPKPSKTTEQIKDSPSKGLDSSSKKLKKLPKMVKQEAVSFSSIQPALLPIESGDVIKDVESKLVVDDWAKLLTVVQTKDGYLPPPQVWNKFKNGQKNKHYNVSLVEQSHQYEHFIEFDIGQVVQISEFQVGVLYNWSNFETDQNYEPLTMILEGGIEQGKSDWKILLKPAKDDGYRINQVTPYVASLIESTCSQNYNASQVLEKLAKKEARFLTLRSRRFLPVSMDISQIVAQFSKKISLGISYMSINGTPLIKSSSLFAYLLDIQKENSLQVLSKFFSGEFTEAFEIISEQPQIIEKIKLAFDRLSTLFDTKANLIKPLFLAICTKNHGLGDWIMSNRLLKFDVERIKKEQLVFLGDIISSNQDTYLDKLQKFKAHIIEGLPSCCHLGENGQKSEDEAKIELMRKYLKLFNNKYYEYQMMLESQDNKLNKDDQQNAGELKINLNVKSIDEINSLVRLLVIEDVEHLNLQSQLIKFTLNLINLNSQNLTNPVDYARSILKEEGDKVAKVYFSSILAIEYPEIYNFVKESKFVDSIRDKINQNTASKSEIVQFGQILQAFSKVKQFKKEYCMDLTFELYSYLFSTEKQMKETGDAIYGDYVRDCLVDTIKELIIASQEAQNEIVDILKKDMMALCQESEINFINKVIVPILKAEDLIPITINQFDPNKKEKGVYPIYEEGDIQINQDKFFLQTQLLNQHQKNTLQKMFKELTQDRLDHKKLVESNWELIFDYKQVIPQDSSKFKQFVNAVSGKSNIFILLSAKVNEIPCLYGGFTNQPFPSLGTAWTHDFDYQIPYSEANFVFQYNQDSEKHFTMTHNKPFGYIYTDYELGGALSISGDFFLISWSFDFQNSCGNIYDMKCVEDPNAVSIYNNMTVQSVEIWCNVPNSTASAGKKQLKSELKKDSSFMSYSPYNYLRQNLVFQHNANNNLQKISEQTIGSKGVFINYPAIEDKIQTLVPIKQLVKEHETYLDLVVLKDAIDDATSDQVQSLQENQPVLKKFSDKGGIQDLIQAAKQSVKKYKIQKLREMWGLWLDEIDSFSTFPTFFEQFCSEKSKEQTIYGLLAGENDFKDPNDTNVGFQATFISQQEDFHLEMVKYTYKIVSEVFEKQNDSQLRDQCLMNGTFLRFVERIGQLTSEKRRVKVDSSELEKYREEQNQSSNVDSSNTLSNTIEQDKTTKVRKGVGYTTGIGTTWNVSEYLKTKEAKNGQITNIINILKNMIHSDNWQAPSEIKDMLLESVLLPTLEAAFRSGSLLEMAKDFELNMSYLELTQEITRHQNLIPLLVDIGEEYQPRQKESVSHLLKKIGELSRIFIDCLPQEQKDQVPLEQNESERPRILAEKILQTHDIVQQQLQDQHLLNNEINLKDILEMPLSKAYELLLSDLRFEYMNMKNSSGIYQHAYISDLPKGLNPPASKLVRLAQEIADLSNSLPCDYTNAIFCRVDKERVDVMKCMIMGASGTPYAHGAFIYDLFFENTYPNGPPKCLLVTTGGQTVRFNPNLYTNGKVCLSLLGTWRGSSTENWDPKLSTILQVLLSIQAIIMSNEVYFNEPGYEHEQGTVEGEKKNEGYSNIVRYCNVKFAMIDTIKHPPAGFEKVIRRSFYLKKYEILKEVKSWVEKAKITDATYQGFVYDHNCHWAPQLSPEGKYAEMMEQVYKELEETLNSLPSPFEDDLGSKLERKFSDQELFNSKPQEEQSKGGKAENFDEIDMTYEPDSDQIQQLISVDDEKVKDRWSRYIGAMGMEAVSKQAEARILVYGLGPLGVEIAKNIVLAGCKELILFDNGNSSVDQLSGQFFISQADAESGRNRVTASIQKIQQLNLYVKVSGVTENQDILKYVNEEKDIKVFVITELIGQKTLIELNKICRDKSIAFIYSVQKGLFSKVFNDFGDEFIVVDKNGEEMQEVMIKNIEYDEKREASVVTLLEGFKHRYQDGDFVKLKEVNGMIDQDDMSKSINELVVQIKVINPQSFSIDLDVKKFTKYEGNGVAKQIKVPEKASFKSLKEVEEDQEVRLDQNLAIYDFTKMEHQPLLHQIFRATQIFIEEEDDSDQDYLTFVLKYMPEQLDDKQKELYKNLAKIFRSTKGSYLPPICAFIGGVVSQEIIKAITQKYMPINQLFYFDCIELFSSEWDDYYTQVVSSEMQESKQSRYYQLERMLGTNFINSIRECQLFMIGAGAIGCELLKNYAMLGLGTKGAGKIIITDPDVIEVSNLNRQFLFREKHLRKPKSLTAAAAAVQMNPDMKDHIEARLDKIHDGTAHIYNEQFFKSMTIVTNALDNVAARLYIDGKCVSAKTPLIDSGTLGPKGHVQIILPAFKTESYGSQNDPEDNHEIPHCTLKMFPEEILHCIEWGKDIFGKLFTIQPQQLNKLFESNEDVNFADQQEVTNLKRALKLLHKEPSDFLGCIKLARDRFQKHFVNDIKQLIHVYPLDKLTKEGRPFWSLPKRPPHPVDFNPDNQTHTDFIAATSCLFAKIFGIDIPYEKPRAQEAKKEMAQQAAQFIYAQFIPNDLKASAIQSKVEKDQQKPDESEDQTAESTTIQQHDQNDVEKLKKEYNENIKVFKSIKDDVSMLMKIEEFEKDNDQNFHIDFIYAISNIRAENYRLEGMDWINVKIKAGRIIPALATTTAAIAGLQTLELLKYLKGCKLEEHKNSFMNLAVPSLMMSEPGPAAKLKLKEGIEVTLWDRWEYDATQNQEVTLLEVIESIEKEKGLSCRDVFYGSIVVFLNALQGRNAAQRKKTLNVPLLLTIKTIEQDKFQNPDFIDLTLTFVDESVPLINGQEINIEGVPAVRVIFKK